VTDIRDRWFAADPRLRAGLCPRALQPRLDRARLKRLLIAAAVVMAGVSAAIPGRILLAERFHRTEPLNRPYSLLARQLPGSIGSALVVVTDTKLLAGNLRLNLPEKIFVTPDLTGLIAEPRRPGVLVWDAMPRKANTETVPSGPPESLREFAKQRGVADLDGSRVEFISATFNYHRARQMSVGSWRCLS